MQTFSRYGIAGTDVPWLVLDLVQVKEAGALDGIERLPEIHLVCEEKYGQPSGLDVCKSHLDTQVFTLTCWMT